MPQGGLDRTPTAPLPLSSATKRAAAMRYGTAGPEFVRRLVNEGVDEVASLVREMVAAFKRSNVSPDADGQVQRAADRFALIGVAGELATEAGGRQRGARGGAHGGIIGLVAGWIEQTRVEAQPSEAGLIDKRNGADLLWAAGALGSNETHWRDRERAEVERAVTRADLMRDV